LSGAVASGPANIFTNKELSMKTIRCLVLLAALAIGMFARQQAASKAAGKVDPKLHGDVLTLVELEDTKARMLAGMKPALEAGKAEIAKGCPNCTPAFADEWMTRMQARLKVEDFVQVAVHAYERYFDDNDVKELIAYGKAKKRIKLPSCLPNSSKSLQP
jgi:hypothetical protein